MRADGEDQELEASGGDAGAGEAELEAQEQKLPDTYQLEFPVQWGESERIEVLKLKGSGRALVGVKLDLKDDTIVFEPYRLAALGLKLAGQPPALLDRMHTRDQVGLGLVALGFIMPSLLTGARPSR